MPASSRTSLTPRESRQPYAGTSAGRDHSASTDGKSVSTAGRDSSSWSGRNSCTGPAAENTRAAEGADIYQGSHEAADSYNRGCRCARFERGVQFWERVTGFAHRPNDLERTHRL